MNPYAPRHSDAAVRGAIVALSDAAEARVSAGLPPLSPTEARELFYAAIGFTVDQVEAGFVAIDAALRAAPRGASTKSAAVGLASNFFAAARAVKS